MGFENEDGKTKGRREDRGEAVTEGQASSRSDSPKDVHDVTVLAVTVSGTARITLSLGFITEKSSFVHRVPWQQKKNVRI